MAIGVLRRALHADRGVRRGVLMSVTAPWSLSATNLESVSAARGTAARRLPGPSAARWISRARGASCGSGRGGYCAAAGSGGPWPRSALHTATTMTSSARTT